MNLSSLYNNKQSLVLAIALIIIAIYSGVVGAYVILVLSLVGVIVALLLQGSSSAGSGNRIMQETQRVMESAAKCIRRKGGILR